MKKVIVFKKANKIMSAILVFIMLFVVSVIPSSALNSDINSNVVVNNGDVVAKKHTKTVMLAGSRRGYRVFSAEEPVVLPNFPCTNQGNEPLCWAYSIQSIVSYLEGFTPSIDDIQAIARNSPTYKDEPVESDYVYVLNFFLHKDKGYNIQLQYRAISKSEMSYHMFRGLPFFMTLQNINARRTYHAVVFVGYDYDSSIDDITAIYIMDPNYGRIDRYPMSSPESFTYVSGSRKWKWIHTISLV